MRVVLGSTLAFIALVALVMRHTFDGTGWVNSFGALQVRIKVGVECMAINHSKEGFCFDKQCFQGGLTDQNSL